MKVLPILASAGVVSAHTIFQNLVVGGKDYGQGNGIRIPTYNGPIDDVTSNSIACNGNPNPTKSTSTIIDVQAGSDVTALWRYMLSTTGTSPMEIMDPTHLGPTMAYLKKVDNAATDSGVGGGWFKIQEDGYNNGVWATSKVIEGQGKHTVKIPQCIESGQYLLRVEMIALHGASNYPGAQFYMECAQINVIGGTGTAKPATVSFPGAYSGSDPGVKLSIYYPPVTNYIIPGPRPMSCAGGNDNNNPPTATSKTTTTTKPTTTTTSKPPPTSSSVGGGAKQWEQCGGKDFSGPTGCVSPFTCKVINEFYHQCT